LPLRPLDPLPSLLSLRDIPSPLPLFPGSPPISYGMRGKRGCWEDLENRIGRGEERQYNILWCEQGIKKKKMFV